MRSLSEFEEIYICTDTIDMRKDINGLSVLAQLELSADWSKSQLFVFTNRSRTLLKILYYDKTGFAVWKKRLEENKLPWVSRCEEPKLPISTSDLNQILSGINIFSKHEEKFYDSVV